MIFELILLSSLNAPTPDKYHFESLLPGSCDSWNSDCADSNRHDVSGVQILNFSVCDLNKDGYKEILIDTYASENFNEDHFPYSDTSAWLMVLDHNLNFLFTPLEFPGPTGSVELLPINTSANETVILGKYIHASPLKGPGKLFLANHKGKLFKEIIIPYDDYLFRMQPLSTNYQKHKNIISGVKLDGGFYKIYENLVVSKVSDIKSTKWLPALLDIDLDGSDEIIALAPDLKKHLILRYNFSHPVEIDFPIQSTMPIFSVKLNGPNPPQLSVQGDQDWKLFDYGINPVYRVRFLIWIGIYLLALSFILVIRKLYSFQL